MLIAPGATVLRTSAEFMLRGLLVLTGRRDARATIHWLMADLARKNPARVELSLDRLMVALQSLRTIRPISPTVLTDSQLQSLRMPALYLVGEHEKIYSAEKAVARLKRVAPQIRVETIPDAGHDLIISQADCVNRHMLDFLGRL